MPFVFIISLFLFNSLPSYSNSEDSLPVIILQLLDAPETPVDSGSILLRSGQFVDSAVLFSNVDNQDLDVIIETSNNIARVLGPDDSLDDQLLPDPISNVSISPVAEGVYISGFIGSSTITLTFSREVSLQSIAINIQSESPTIGFTDFSVTIPSISGFNSNGELIVTENPFSENTFFLVSALSGVPIPLTFTINESVSSLTFLYSGSPGSGFSIPSLNLQQ